MGARGKGHTRIHTRELRVVKVTPTLSSRRCAPPRTRTRQLQLIGEVVPVLIPLVLLVDGLAYQGFVQVGPFGVLPHERLRPGVDEVVEVLL